MRIDNEALKEVYPELALYSWRAEQDWTQEQAAKWAGVSARSWRRYEGGGYVIPRWLLTKIARRQAALARHGTRR